jgi:hypothetical protein
MNNFTFRIEHILIFVLYFALLFSLWHIFKENVKELRKQVKSRPGCVFSVLTLYKACPFGASNSLSQFFWKECDCIYNDL